MTLFVLGLTIFYGAHVATALVRGPRAALIRSLGAGPYKGLYSLVSAIGLGLIVYGWRAADASPLFAPPAFGRHAAYALTLVAFVLLAAAYLPKGKIAAAVRHPMLSGVSLWALGHLLANGETRSVILFGSLLVYGVLDRVAVEVRRATVPAAGPATNDLYPLLAGAALWAAIYFYLHPYLAGVALR